MHSLDTVAPAFVEMAHRIVWCVAATTGADGGPRTRVLHPIWEWDGGTLTGWIATSPALAEGGRPVGHAAAVAHVLVPEPRHVHGRLRAVFEHRPGRSGRRVGALRRRAVAGGLRPVDHPGLDEPRVTRFRDPPPDTAPPAGDAGHGDAPVRARRSPGAPDPGASIRRRAGSRRRRGSTGSPRAQWWPVRRPRSPSGPHRRGREPAGEPGRQGAAERIAGGGACRSASTAMRRQCAVGESVVGREHLGARGAHRDDHRRQPAVEQGCRRRRRVRSRVRSARSHR